MKFRISHEYDCDGDGEGGYRCTQNELHVRIDGHREALDFACAEDSSIPGIQWSEIAETLEREHREHETLKARLANSVDADTLEARLRADLILYADEGAETAWNEGIERALVTLKKLREGK